MVDQRRRPVRTRPRGYGAPLGALIAGLLALIAFNLTRHSGAPSTPHASVHPSITVTAAPSITHASPAGQAPAGRGAQPAPVQAAGAAAPSSPAPPSPTPTPVPSPPPSPTPRPRPLLAVTAAIVAPLRGATPVAARATIVIPAAPPFPNPLLELRLGLSLG